MPVRILAASSRTSSVKIPISSAWPAPRQNRWKLCEMRRGRPRSRKGKARNAAHRLGITLAKGMARRGRVLHSVATCSYGQQRTRRLAGRASYLGRQNLGLDHSSIFLAAVHHSTSQAEFIPRLGDFRKRGRNGAHFEPAGRHPGSSGPRQQLGYHRHRGIGGAVLVLACPLSNDRPTLIAFSRGGTLRGPAWQPSAAGDSHLTLRTPLSG